MPLLSRPILGRVIGEQPIYRHDEAGGVTQWGRLTWLANDQLHVQCDRREWQLSNELPWFLAPLRLSGFLGRLAASTPTLSTLSSLDPERWSIEEQLYAAIAQVDDGSGALTIGDPDGGPSPEPSPTDGSQRGLHYDRIARHLSGHCRPGSSAGGRQAKFLANRMIEAESRASWEHLLVKFSPPQGTPFGDRWHDLLYAEHLALTTLGAAGEPVALSRVIESPTSSPVKRTYFESVRFDRMCRLGRRHAVALEAVHEAFVGGSRQHWAVTADALAAQRRLSTDDARRVRLWRAFGRLIGNTDMNFGNLSLWADDPDVERFTLAPCYDMLPMKYQPSRHGFDLNPIDLHGWREPDATLWPLACRLARSFWQRVADHAPCSAGFRTMAHRNAERIETP